MIFLIALKNNSQTLYKNHPNSQYPNKQHPNSQHFNNQYPHNQSFNNLSKRIFGKVLVTQIINKVHNHHKTSIPVIHSPFRQKTSLKSNKILLTLVKLILINKKLNKRII